MIVLAIIAFALEFETRCPAFGLGLELDDRPSASYSLRGDALAAPLGHAFLLCEAAPQGGRGWHACRRAVVKEKDVARLLRANCLSFKNSDQKWDRTPAFSVRSQVPEPPYSFLLV